MAKVVTHQYTDGTCSVACAQHDNAVPDFSRGGASYSGVYRGAHEGCCDYCAQEQDKRE